MLLGFHGSNLSKVWSLQETQGGSRIGSVKEMDGKWWAVSPDGKGDGPHPTRNAAAHWLLRERRSGSNPGDVLSTAQLASLTAEVIGGVPKEKSTLPDTPEVDDLRKKIAAGLPDMNKNGGIVPMVPFDWEPPPGPIHQVEKDR